MAKPDKYPEWASQDIVDSVSGVNNVIEPEDSRKPEGWKRDEKPSRQYMNWLHRKNYEWIKYLDESVDDLFVHIGAVSTGLLAKRYIGLQYSHTLVNDTGVPYGMRITNGLFYGNQNNTVFGNFGEDIEIIDDLGSLNKLSATNSDGVVVNEFTIDNDNSVKLLYVFAVGFISQDGTYNSRIIIDNNIDGSNIENNVLNYIENNVTVDKVFLFAYPLGDYTNVTEVFRGHRNYINKFEKKDNYKISLTGVTYGTTHPVEILSANILPLRDLICDVDIVITNNINANTIGNLRFEGVLGSNGGIYINVSDGYEGISMALQKIDVIKGTVFMKYDDVDGKHKTILTCSFNNFDSTNIDIFIRGFKIV